MDARQALLQVLFPLVFEVKPTMPRSKARSSYGMKHDFEKALGFYFSNSETIPALVALGVPHFVGDPNYGFKVKEKFPLSWIRNAPPSTRPKYESKAKWDAFLHAQTEIALLLTDLLGDDTTTDRFSRLAAQVGHEGQAKSEVPACLTARLASVSAGASGSQ
jgi:hypothetical protein